LSIALLTPDPDDKLLRGAGAILTALIQGHGGPVEGIEAYEAGPAATELYLMHLQTRDLDLQGFNNVARIDQFLKEDSNETEDFTQGWKERSATLLALTNAILSRPGWEQMVRDGLDSDDRQTFWTATEAARQLGLDAWDVYFDRVKRGEDLWHFLAQTKDNDRIDRVASGPSDSLGIGPEFEHHNALSYVLQELRRFPGKGWPLIRTGMQSPVVRNRSMAVMALAAWDRTTWPNEAEPLLRSAIALEPNEQTLEIMVKTIDQSV
jgi:hypothetical protein